MRRRNVFGGAAGSSSGSSNSGGREGGGSSEGSAGGRGGSCDEGSSDADARGSSGDEGGRGDADVRGSKGWGRSRREPGGGGNGLPGMGPRQLWGGRQVREVSFPVWCWCRSLHLLPCSLPSLALQFRGVAFPSQSAATTTPRHAPPPPAQDPCRNPLPCLLASNWVPHSATVPLCFLLAQMRHPLRNNTHVLLPCTQWATPPSCLLQEAAPPLCLPQEAALTTRLSSWARAADAISRHGSFAVRGAVSQLCATLCVTLREPAA